MVRHSDKLTAELFPPPTCLTHATLPTVNIMSLWLVMLVPVSMFSGVNVQLSASL